jgi:hypothetical protein
MATLLDIIQQETEKAVLNRNKNDRIRKKKYKDSLINKLNNVPWYRFWDRKSFKDKIIESCKYSAKLGIRNACIYLSYEFSNELIVELLQQSEEFTGFRFVYVQAEYDYGEYISAKLEIYW